MKKTPKRTKKYNKNMKLAKERNKKYYKGDNNESEYKSKG